MRLCPSEDGAGEGGVAGQAGADPGGSPAATSADTYTVDFTHTSVLFRAGHRIRIAIAGADTFARVPAEGTPTWTVERNPARASHISLPVIPR